MAEPAPLTDTPAAPVPPGGTAEWFTGAGGYRLRAARFAPEGHARGSVVLSGGRTEPIEKYFEVVRELVARGFVVVVHDWRGQGLSQRLLPDRLKGHAHGYQDFLTDYHALITAFEDRMPRPWIAVGHSMGGCLTFLALTQGENRFAASVLSAPMLALLTGSVPKPLAKAVAAVMPVVGRGAVSIQGRNDAGPTPFEANIITHDEGRYERNQAQVNACPDLALGGPTWGWLNFAYRAMGRLTADAGRITIPVTVIGAGDDRLVDVKGQQAVVAMVPYGKFVLVPDAFHEILQEKDEVRAVFWREFDALADKVAPK